MRTRVIKGQAEYGKAEHDALRAIDNVYKRDVAHIFKKEAVRVIEYARGAIKGKDLVVNGKSVAAFSSYHEGDLEVEANRPTNKENSFEDDGGPVWYDPKFEHVL